MVAAVAVAVGASAAAASDTGAGNHATKTAWHVSDDSRGGKVAHDSPVSATGKATSAQSTPASANGDHSASPFKPTVDQAAALMSSWRRAATDKATMVNEATMVAAVAVAVGASAAAASDAGAGNHATKTAWHVSDDGRGGKIAHDSPVSATGKDTSAQSTPASANGDHSASPFKPTVDHHAIVDPGIKLDLIPTDHLLQHPADNLLHIPAQPDHGADPAHPYVDGNQSASADDSNAHPGKVAHDPPAPTARSSDLSGDDSAQPFKTNLDHHAVEDPETNSPSNSNNHPLQQPAHNSLHTPRSTTRFIRPRSTTTTAHLL